MQTNSANGELLSETLPEIAVTISSTFSNSNQATTNGMLGQPEKVALNTTEISNQPKKRVVSEEARKRISESQKARWAKSPRTLSGETKQKISEAQKARWAGRTSTPDVKKTKVEPKSRRQGYSTLYGTMPSTKVENMTDLSGLTLAVKEGYTGDRFFIHEDGHYVGDDGFIIPQNFDEFFDRFPKLISTWVRKRLKTTHASQEDIEDWCQDLIIHMKYLPLKSKHRDEGKEDVIQVFDPFAQYGASERRWRNYINFCLANKFNTIHSKKSKNPLCRPGNLTISTDTNPENKTEVSDEFVYSKSNFLMSATLLEEKKNDDRFFASRFIEYVHKTDSNVFPILEAVYVAGSSTDTVKEFCKTCNRLATTMEVQEGEHEGHAIGLTQKEFNKARTRLKQLATAFMEAKDKSKAVMA